MAYQTPYVTVYVDEPETAEIQTSSSRRRQREAQHWLDSDNPLRHVRMRLQATSNPDPFVDAPVATESWMAAPGLPCAAATQRFWASQQSSSSTDALDAANQSTGGHTYVGDDTPQVALEDFCIYGSIFYQPYRRPPYQPIPTMAQILEQMIPIDPQNPRSMLIYPPIAIPVPTATAIDAELAGANEQLHHMSLGDKNSDQRSQPLNSAVEHAKSLRQPVNVPKQAIATGDLEFAKRDGNLGRPSAATDSSTSERKRKREHDAAEEEEIKLERNM